MSVSLTTITGPVYLPNGATPVGGRVSFELSSWDQEEGAGLVISGPVYTTIDNNGQFSVELYTSTAGVNSVHYRMFVIWEDSELSESYVNDIYVGTPTPHYTKKYIGSFALSGPGPFQVSDLNIISETNNSSFDAYLEMKAFADRIDLGMLDDAVAATGADRATVTPLAAQVVLDAAQVAADRSATGVDVIAADAARVLTDAARDAAVAGAILTWPTTAAGVGSGIVGVTSIVAGSDGTNGTFALAYSGGTQVLAPVGVFTVAGGALVSVVVTYPGYYSAGTPTLSFAASAGLTGASAVAQMAANTPVNGFFAVPSTVTSEAAIIYKNVAGVATEQYRTLSSAINGYESEPFPADTFETSQLFRMVDLVAPSNLLVSAGNLVTVPNTGVYYAKLPLTSSGYVVGDVIRVAIKKVSGATMPASFRFLNAANAAITTLSFVLVNGWYIAEGAIPALTVSLNIFYTNSGGDSSVFYQPKLARQIARTAMDVADRRNVAGFVADAGDPKNYWSPVVVQVFRAGAGVAVINSDGTVTVPAGLSVELRPDPLKFILPTTGVLTVVTRLSSANVGSVKCMAYGAVSGATTFDMVSIGDGYWRWTGQPLVSGQTQINNICLIIDNRTPATAGYTAASIVLQDCLVVQGAGVPDHKIPMGATTSDRIIAYAGIPAAIADKTVKIASTGGDYTTVPNALAVISDAASNRRYVLSVATGTYQTAEWHDVDFVDVVGAGIGNSIIDFQQPDGTISADVIAYSAINMTNTSRLEGMTVRTRNGRYGIHLDGFKKFPNRMQEIINCRVEHMGNVNPYWSAENGIGAGMSSGQTIRLRGSTILAKNGAPLSYHTNSGFIAPTLMDIEDCTLIAHISNIALIIIPSGSDVADKCRVVGTILGGDIQYKPATWFPITLAKQPANHCEIAVSGHGNSPAVFRNEDFGEALQIVSANTGAGSSVVVGGDAVAVIFGDGTSAKYDSRDGTSGFAGRVSGWGDVSGVAVGSPATYLITSLGTRLGDCSTVNKTLTVAVDGGAR